MAAGLLDDVLDGVDEPEPGVPLDSEIVPGWFSVWVCELPPVDTVPVACVLEPPELEPEPPEL